MANLEEHLAYSFFKEHGINWLEEKPKK